jgi:hypothetical protein
VQLLARGSARIFVAVLYWSGFVGPSLLWAKSPRPAANDLAPALDILQRRDPNGVRVRRHDYPHPNAHQDRVGYLRLYKAVPT